MPQNTVPQSPVLFPVSEPCNRASEEEYKAYNPSTGPADGEDRSKRQIIAPDELSDTGGTVEDFNHASKQIAQVLKNIDKEKEFDSDKGH